jgi:hypothetical protein
MKHTKFVEQSNKVILNPNILIKISYPKLISFNPCDNKKYKIIYDPVRSDELWNQAQSHESFDDTIFRMDYLDNIVIKDAKFNLDPTGFFAGNYYKTTEGEYCLLKSNTTLCDNQYLHELYIKNFKNKMNPDTLESLLKYKLHDTCIKYNVLFCKNTKDKWTIKKSVKYSNEYQYENTPVILYNRGYSISTITIIIISIITSKIITT